MPIFYRDHQYILYIHVPKTGGRFIQETFVANGYQCGFMDTSNITTEFNRIRTCSPQHYHANLLRQTVRFNRLSCVFMTVRNPLDRIKSEFLWRERDPSVDPDVWLKHILSVYPSDNFILDNHIRPQTEFLIDGADVFRTEDGFNRDWLQLLNTRLGLNFELLPETRPNSSRINTGKDSSDVALNEESMDLIRNFYRADFERFGYVMP
jgi:hypothetical protein